MHTGTHTRTHCDTCCCTHKCTQTLHSHTCIHMAHTQMYTYTSLTYTHMYTHGTHTHTCMHMYVSVWFFWGFFYWSATRKSLVLRVEIFIKLTVIYCIWVRVLFQWLAPPDFSHTISPMTNPTTGAFRPLLPWQTNFIVFPFHMAVFYTFFSTMCLCMCVRACVCMCAYVCVCAWCVCSTCVCVCVCVQCVCMVCV